MLNKPIQYIFANEEGNQILDNYVATMQRQPLNVGSHTVSNDSVSGPTLIIFAIMRDTSAGV